jgi:hypothetical protein
MKQILRTIAATIVLLFSAQGAQAALMPTPDVSFGLLDNQTENSSADLPDSHPNIIWFEFELGSTQNVTLDTYGSSLSARKDILGVNDLPANDTILGLYDSTGSLLDQNDDCGFDFESCLDFIGPDALGAGIYLAGVANTFYPYEFVDMWGTDIGDDTGAGPPFNVGGGQIQFNITVSSVSAVPVPAAFWLFGTALIGFVGMSRRTSVKS